MKKFAIPLILLLFCSYGQSQNIFESLRYSTYNYGSTARALGSGSAFGAIGADLSVASTNPAGLAEFRKSEFSFAADLSKVSAESTLVSSTNNESKNIFNVQQVGAVFYKAPIASSWTTTNLVINFNRLANFDENISYAGTTLGSITERFTERANGRGLDELDDFEAGPAYDSFAIFDEGDDLFYESDFGSFNLPVSKGQEIERRGGISEFSISYAGAWKNKLLIGGGVGVPILSFREIKTYFETDPSYIIEVFDNLFFEETLETTGIGLNARLGLLYKITPKIRVGASVHSPTTFFLSDQFTTTVNYQFTLPGFDQTNPQSSPEGLFEYHVKTPMRSILSAAYLFKVKKIYGFLSTEVEFVDYSGNSFDLTTNTNFEGDQILENDLNNQIENQFKTGTNIRLGTELIYNKFVLRGGYNINGNQLVLEDNSSNVWSAGLGYKLRNFYLDLAYQKTSGQESYTPYFVIESSRNQTIDIDKSFNRLRISLGFKFD